MDFINKVFCNYIPVSESHILAQEIIDANLRTICYDYLQLECCPKVVIKNLCNDELKYFDFDQIHARYNSLYWPEKHMSGTVIIYATAICSFVNCNKRKFTEYVLKSLCHELVHYKQEIFTGVNLYDHMNKKINDIMSDFDSYFNDPYEIEARKLEEEIYQRIIFKLS